jgi:hypothetical protein
MNTFLNFKYEGFTNYYPTRNLHADINRRGNWELNHCSRTGDKEAKKRASKQRKTKLYENFFKGEAGVCYHNGEGSKLTGSYYPLKFNTTFH